MAAKSPEVRKIIGSRKDPLIVQVLQAENPQFRNAVNSLRHDGAHLSLYRVRQTPHAMRDAMQQLTTANLDLPLITAQALVESGDITRRPPTMGESDIQKLRLEARSFLHVEGADSRDSRMQTINNILENDTYAKKYAVRRLTADRTSGEEDEFRKIATIAGIAIALGFSSEIGLPHLIHNLGWQHNPSWMPGFVPNLDQVALGVGLAITGQADDVAGFFLNAKTEDAGRKGTRQIIRENPQIAWAVAAAMATDLFIMPKLFEFHSLPMEFVQGGVFALTATAGSLAAKWGNVERNQKHLLELDLLGQLPGRGGRKNTLTDKEKRFFGLPWKENQSHPYRNGLFWGLLLSGGMSLTASLTGQLEGHLWSPFIQGAIGPAESITAIVGAAGLIDWNNDHGVNRLRSDHQLRQRLRKANRNL